MIMTQKSPDYDLMPASISVGGVPKLIYYIATAAVVARRFARLFEKKIQYIHTFQKTEKPNSVHST